MGGFIKSFLIKFGRMYVYLPTPTHIKIEIYLADKDKNHCS